MRSPSCPEKQHPTEAGERPTEKEAAQAASLAQSYAGCDARKHPAPCWKSSPFPARENGRVRHRRSIDLLAPVRTTPVEWPSESRRSPRYWQKITDAELERIGKYLGEQVKAARTVHQQDLDEARREWRRRHSGATQTKR